MKCLALFSLSLLWISPLSGMLARIPLKTPSPIQKRYSSERLQSKLKIADELLNAKKRDQHIRAKSYHIPQYIIANALSEANSLHDHRCIWLWPEELEPLLHALQNSRSTIYGVDRNQQIVSTFYGFNFPFHKLVTTLEHYRADAHMDDIDNDQLLANAYTKINERVETLCTERFSSICPLFETENPLEACRMYHYYMKQLSE